MDLISRVGGEESIVVIYRDRVEWTGIGVKVGASLHLGSSMIPFGLIRGVSTRQIGFGRTELRIAMLGDFVEFRVSSRQAEEARSLLLRLESGLNPSAA